VSPASWDDRGAASPLVVTRRWQRCRRDGSECSDVAGAAGSTYVLGDADLNRRMRVVEVASNDEGSSQTASLLTDVVTREDGTLPDDNDGVDNDADGQVDEPGETGPAGDAGSGAGSGSGSGGTTATPSGSAVALRPSAPVSSSERSSDAGAGGAGAVNGEGASPRAELRVRFAGGASTKTLAYGRSITAEGRLTDPGGRPIRNAIVDVVTTAAVRGARPQAAGQPAVTGADGSFRYSVRARGASRVIAFSYRYLREGDVVATASVRLQIRAGLRLAVRLRGAVARYGGRVIAGSLPRAGKLVLLQGRSAGASWQTFASRRAKSRGRFRGAYRLKVRRPGARLQFRARVVNESGWPYTGTTSRVVTRRVR